MGKRTAGEGDGESLGWDDGVGSNDMNHTDMFDSIIL